MEDFVAENDNQRFQHRNVVPNENENTSSPLSSLISIECRYNGSDIANTVNMDHGDDTVQQDRSNSNENTATIIDTIATANTGGSTHDAYINHNYNTTTNNNNNNNNNDEEEFTTVSMSPDERNTFFPSSSSRRSLLQEQQQQQQQYTNYSYNGSDDHSYHPTTRHSRESVLQRLCEALLRRSLTKVRIASGSLYD